MTPYAERPVVVTLVAYGAQTRDDSLITKIGLVGARWP